MNATALLDPDDEESRDAATCNEGDHGEEHRPNQRRAFDPAQRRAVTAVDLRRRTSEIIAALERNEELMVSHRDRWVGIMTPINLIEGFGFHPPLRRHRYFGYARRSPKLRRRDDESEVTRRSLMNQDPREEASGTPRDREPQDDLLRMFELPGHAPDTTTQDDE